MTGPSIEDIVRQTLTARTPASSAAVAANNAVLARLTAHQANRPKPSLWQRVKAETRYAIGSALLAGANCLGLYSAEDDEDY